MRWTVLLLCVALAGCASDGVSDLRDREWKMVWVEGFEAMPAGVATPTVRFDTDGRFSGNTGCNSAGAAYVVDDGELTIRPMLVTKRACMNPEGNRLEHAWLQAVEKAKRFRITDGQLELLSADGTVRARFR